MSGSCARFGSVFAKSAACGLLPLSLSSRHAALHNGDPAWRGQPRLAQARLDENMLPNCMHGQACTPTVLLQLSFAGARLKLRRHSARLMCHRRTVQSTDADSRKWAGVQLRSTTSCGAGASNIIRSKRQHERQLTHLTAFLQVNAGCIRARVLENTKHLQQDDMSCYAAFSHGLRDRQCESSVMNVGFQQGAWLTTGCTVCDHRLGFARLKQAR